MLYFVVFRAPCFFQVFIWSIRAGRRLTSRALLGASTKIDFEVIDPDGRSQQEIDEAVTAMVVDSRALINHIVSAVASDDGMKADLAAEGMTLVDLAVTEAPVAERRVLELCYTMNHVFL